MNHIQINQIILTINYNTMSFCFAYNLIGLNKSKDKIEILIISNQFKYIKTNNNF